MRKLIFIPLLLFILTDTFSQQHAVDSLAKRLRDYQTEDSALVDLRNEYSKQNLFINPGDTLQEGFILETLKMAETLNYPKGVLMANERLGIMYQYLVSDPYRAMDYYQQALAVAKDHQHLKKYTTGITGNIGNIYYEQEEYEKALAYFREVLGYQNEMELAATANIANIYGELSRPDSAIHYFQKAIVLCEEQNHTAFLANCLSNLALIYNSIGETAQAKKSIEKSLDLIDAHHIEYVRTVAYTNAATIHLTDRNYKKAESFALMALNLETSLNNLPSQKAVWGTLAEVYEATNRYKESLGAYKMFSSLKDSLTQQDRKVEISRKEMQFEYDTKEALLKAENETRQALAQVEIDKQKTIKNAYVFSGSGLLLLSVFGLAVYKRKRDAVAQKQEAEFKATVAETELKALRAQMNPHFIFNSLNAIGDYFSKNNKEAAYDYLAKFAKLMRQTLENSTQREILLEDELNFIELYLQLETKRLNHNFTYNIKLDENIDQQNTLVPPLILQPFIENSIWHGFSTNAGKGHVDIEIRQEANMLVCCVDDNGVGRKQAKITTAGKQSMGVEITKNRLAILNKEKQTNGQLNIIDKTNGQGVRVEVSFPLHLSF